uniref:Uncharacterized protein n=1 Tax=Tetradesmus obliquus TaxID=3088 RepID=A0A383V1Y8_TETOB
MHQLLSFQHFNEAKVLLSKSDQQSRLRGLALVLHGNFNAVGWPYMDADLMPIVRAALQQQQQQHCVARAFVQGYLQQKC